MEIAKLIEQAEEFDVSDIHADLDLLVALAPFQPHLILPMLEEIGEWINANLQHVDLQHIKQKIKE